MQQNTRKPLRLPGVLGMTGLGGKSSVYDAIKNRGFPKPHKPYGPRISIWFEDEVSEWLQAQIADSADDGEGA